AEQVPPVLHVPQTRAAGQPVQRRVPAGAERGPVQPGDLIRRATEPVAMPRRPDNKFCHRAYPPPWLGGQAHPSADAMSAMIIRTFPDSARPSSGTRHQQPELRMETEPKPIAIGDRDPLARLDGLAVDPRRASGIR